jgi:hypothetical protein
MSAIVITPGTTITPGQTYTDAIMEAIANPTGQIPAGSITDTELSAGLAAQVGVSQNRNYFLNSNFCPRDWWIGPGPFNCMSGLDTFGPKGWFCRPASGKVSIQQTADVVTTTTNNDNTKSVYGLLATGSSTATGIVEIGQNIAPDNAAILAQPIAVSFYLFNATGAAFQPVINFYSAGAFGNFATFTLLGSVTAASCPNAAWTKVTGTINGAGWTTTNGVRITVALPAGTMSSSGDQVTLCQMKCELGSVTQYVPERESLLLPLFDNAFRNGNLADDFWNGTSQTCPTGSDTYACQDWWCQPSGGNATYWQTPSGLPNADWAALITGLTGCTQIDFGQNVRKNIAGLCGQNMTFSCMILNGTGSTVTPTLRVDTPASVDGWTGTMTNELSQALGPVASGSWTEIEFTFNPASLANAANGMRVYLQIPLTIGQSVQFAGLKLEPGSEPTARRIENTQPERKAILAAAKNLNINGGNGSIMGVNGSKTAYISADEIIVKDGAGNAVIIRPLNTVTVNGMDTGTWPSSGVTILYIWLFWNGTTAAGVFSLSSTAPAVPNGFPFSALVGTCIYNSSSAGGIVAFQQLQNQVWVQPVAVLGSSGGAGAGSTGNVALQTAGLVPLFARAIKGYAAVTTAAAVQVGMQTDDINATGSMVAGAGSGGSGTVTDPATGLALHTSAYWEVPGNATTLYWSWGDSTANKVIAITGWVL